MQARAVLISVVLVFAGLVLAASSSLAATDTVWQGGPGDWFGPGWSNGPPDGDFNALIDGGKPIASNVTLLSDAAVVNLTIDVNDTLRVGAGQLTVHGVLDGAGGVQVDSFNNPHPTRLSVTGEARLGGLDMLYSGAQFGRDLTLLEGGASLTGSTLAIAGTWTTTGYIQMFQSGARISGDFILQSPSGVRLWDNVDALSVSGTLTNGTGAFVTNPGRAPLSMGRFANAGDVVAWSPLMVTDGNYVQTAGTTALPVFPFAQDPAAERGRLVVEHGIADFRGGMLTGLGIVEGDVDMGGVLALDRTSASDPHFQIQGRYTQEDGGILKIYINDIFRTDEMYGDLRVSGDVLLGGTVDFVFCRLCVPRTGDEFAFLSYAHRLGDSRFTAVEFENWTPPEWSLDYGPNGVTLRITQGFIPSPEPGVALLSFGGLVAVVLCHTRRRRSRGVVGRDVSTYARE